MKYGREANSLILDTANDETVFPNMGTIELSESKEHAYFEETRHSNKFLGECQSGKEEGEGVDRKRKTDPQIDEYEKRRRKKGRIRGRYCGEKLKERLRMVYERKTRKTEGNAKTYIRNIRKC